MPAPAGASHDEADRGKQPVKGKLADGAIRSLPRYSNAGGDHCDDEILPDESLPTTGVADWRDSGLANFAIWSSTQSLTTRSKAGQNEPPDMWIEVNRRMSRRRFTLLVLPRWLIAMSKEGFQKHFEDRV